MKTPIFLLTSALCTTLIAAPPGKRQRVAEWKANRADRVSETAAMKEEALLDHVDTHKWKRDPEATDRRLESLTEYHNYSYRRITRLLHHGALTEEDGRTFKVTHTDITEKGREMRGNGELTKEEKTELRKDLDTLNDDINAKLKASEEASARTPLLNRAQHRMEEKIEFGERSGRLSKGEASRLKRDVARLAATEERLKADNDLSTREREKLFEEALEVRRELEKELRD